MLYSGFPLIRSILTCAFLAIVRDRHSVSRIMAAAVHSTSSLLNLDDSQMGITGVEQFSLEGIEGIDMSFDIIDS